MWPPSSATRVLNYSLPHDMGMVGLRDLFVVAPASSFHHSNLNEHNLMAEGLGAGGGGSNPATALGVGLGVIPLLTSAPCIAEDGSGSNRNRGGTGIQLWQSQKSSLMLDNSHHHHNTTASMMQAIGSSSSTTTCQDCGNQAKKDCCHRRCRTCCKSRGYDCSTHVKSTWVPASRRRERQLLAGSTGASSASISLSGSGVKKARLVNSSTAGTASHTSNSNTPPRSFETTSCHQDAGFKESLPGQIMAQAKFKCVKVTSLNDGEDEFAYQALVSIGGHVFKGLLYNQGEESREHQSQGMPNLSDLHLGGGGGGMQKGGGCSSAGMDAPLADEYGGGGGSGSGVGMLGGGSGYGNPLIN